MMVSKEVFKYFMTELINQWTKRDEMFDSINEFINFEPFFEVDFYHIAVKGIAIAINADSYENVAKDLDYWITHYCWGQPEKVIISCGEKVFYLITVDDLYDYLAEMYMTEVKEEMS